MCAVMSYEWHIGYAFKTGWKSTDSSNSLVDESVDEGNHVLNGCK